MNDDSAALKHGARRKRKSPKASLRGRSSLGIHIASNSHEKKKPKRCELRQICEMRNALSALGITRALTIDRYEYLRVLLVDQTFAVISIAKSCPHASLAEEYSE